MWHRYRAFVSNLLSIYKSVCEYARVVSEWLKHIDECNNCHLLLIFYTTLIISFRILDI